MSINDNSIQKNNEQQEQRKIINKMLKSAWEFCDAYNKIKPQYREQAIKELIGEDTLFFERKTIYKVKKNEKD